ncbi:MerR family transcriptional regulator [Streptomyces sp. TP-A0874]|uniref:MerR family transcriptional regulator n=1 Tax=Streptomyces sp. TP-A0874 TaxID=549819 RepID=UPI000853BA33|nr:MerR family transcriptional regulator [Streptomyces sp. TP-A0874]
MELLSIGAFARASGLSPKALRLYDQLGLLPPADVDRVSGYRRYAPEQLEQARLVAWLRRLGMPLAGIQRVCALGRAEAAEEVRAFWARIEAETAARRGLAAFLVGHLSREESIMSATAQPLEIRCAGLSDTGLVRESNQDAVYAGSRLLAVADGFGDRGAPASGAAVEVFKGLEGDDCPAGSLLEVLEEAVERAGRAVHEIAGSSAPDRSEVGTTLTAMLWTGSRLALVHIGDSRAYLLRDGELFQITHDHTVVQTMLDEGRITPEEAASHPQRSLLVRALTGGGGATADIRLHEARQGDRYLVCSDGLSTVVPVERMRRVLRTAGEPARAVAELVALANRAGGPDNVSCGVADVVALGC